MRSRSLRIAALSLGVTGSTGATGPTGLFSYSVVGTTDVSTAANLYPTAAAWVLMPQMTLTLTPVNTKVYVEFSARCTYSATNFDEHRMRYRIVQDGTVIKEFHSYGQTVFNATQTTTITYPLTAAPGVSTTVTIEWLAESVSSPTVSFFNYPATQAYTFRSLIVTDKP